MKRNSSIELLKVIAIVMIILCHSVPFGLYTNYNSFIDLNYASYNISNLSLLLIRHLGSIGNCIFLICSSYFLTSSTKVSIKKVLRIIIYSVIINILFFIVFYIGLGVKGAFTSTELIKMFFPITFGLNWYLTCYLLLYIIHPLINHALNSITKNQHLMYSILFVVLFSIINFLNHELLYYNDLIGFVMIYVLISYIKKYCKSYVDNKRVNIIILLLSLSMLIISILVLNYLGMSFSFFNGKLLHFNSFNNPLIILICISLFNLFIQKQFYNNTINYLSSISLLIYIIHGNDFIEGFFKGVFYDFMVNNYGNNRIVLYALLLFVIYAVGSIVIATIFTYVEKMIFRLKRS